MCYEIARRGIQETSYLHDVYCFKNKILLHFVLRKNLLVVEVLQHTVITDYVFTGEYYNLNVFLPEHNILKFILCLVKCSLETADAVKINKMLSSLLVST
jgi:hypothetical protein